MSLQYRSRGGAGIAGAAIRSRLKFPVGFAEMNVGSGSPHSGRSRAHVQEMAGSRGSASRWAAADRGVPAEHNTARVRGSIPTRAKNPPCIQQWK